MADGKTSLHWFSVAVDPATALCPASSLAGAEPIGVSRGGSGDATGARQRPTRPICECARLFLCAGAGQPDMVYLRGLRGDDSPPLDTCRAPRRTPQTVQPAHSPHTPLVVSCATPGEDRARSFFH